MKITKRQLRKIIREEKTQAREKKFYKDRLAALRSIDRGEMTHETNSAQKKALAAFPVTNAERSAASAYDGTNASMEAFTAASKKHDPMSTATRQIESVKKENNKTMKITTKQLRNIVKEELSKIEKAKLLDEARPSEMSMHDAAEHYSQQRVSAGLDAYSDGMRMLLAVISNLEEAGDMENAELVKEAMKDLKNALRTMREI